MQTETIEIVKTSRIWRIQGDIQEGDLSTLQLDIFWRIDWVNSEGKTINSEPGGEVKFAPTPELLANFQTIADAIYSQINPLVPAPE